MRPLKVVSVYSGPEAADADLLALATRRARDGDAGDVAERVRDVVVGKFAELERADGILHGAGAALQVHGTAEAGAHAGDDDGLEILCVLTTLRGLRKCSAGGTHSASAMPRESRDRVRCAVFIVISQ